MKAGLYSKLYVEIYAKHRILAGDEYIMFFCNDKLFVEQYISKSSLYTFN